MKLRTLLAALVASLLTAIAVSQAQVPGVNSTLNSVFTLAYDNSTMKPTYSTTTPVFALASAATDVCTLQGSATKTLKVRRVLVAGAATAVATDPVIIVKRSTAATTGTSAVVTVIPYDSANVASTANSEYYTANPTVGTIVANLQTKWLTYANLTTGVGAAVEFIFGTLGQPIVLRGVAQNIAVNLVGSTVAGGVMTCTFEWTEE